MNDIKRQKKRWIVVALLAIGLGCGGYTLTQSLPIFPEWIAEQIELPVDIMAYLADQEARFDDLVANTEKTIVWADEVGVQTPLAVVYLHGFSASRQETAPLSEQVAQALGANLFYTRLTGHGQPPAALAAAQVTDWMDDALEALAIGQRLGERVVLIGNSTGATIATWLAAQNLDPAPWALVLLSPHYGLRDVRSEWVTWPGGLWLAQTLIGPEYHSERLNERHARYWTNSYPVAALRPMIQIVQLTRQAPLEEIVQPILIIYSPEDQVVDPARILWAFERFGASHKLLRAVPTLDHGSRHILAGDILAPDDTEAIAQMIVGFVNEMTQFTAQP